MKKIISFFLVATITLFMFLPLNVLAEEEKVLVIFEAIVDPRIKAQGSSVRIEFENEYTGEAFFVILQDYNNYVEKVEMEKGSYITVSGDVSGDYERKFVPEYVRFLAAPPTTNVKFAVGDPNYSGEVETNTNHLIGDIDHSKTNDLLEQDNLPTVNWEYMSEAMDPNAPYNPDNPYMGNIPAEDVTNSTNPEIDDPNNPPASELEETTTDTTEPTTNENGEVVKEGFFKRNSKYITLIIIILIVVIILYFRYKNRDAFEYDDDEDVDEPVSS